jgi:hypothetical protein
MADKKSIVDTINRKLSRNVELTNNIKTIVDEINKTIDGKCDRDYIQIENRDCTIIISIPSLGIHINKTTDAIYREAQIQGGIEQGIIKILDSALNSF